MTQMRVAFITTGYPSTEAPNRAVFTHRSITELANYIDPLVIHLRTWRFARTVCEQRYWAGIPVLSVALPQIPLRKAFYWNVTLLARIGFPFVRRALESAELIQSIGLYPGGYIGNCWATVIGKPHISEAIGSDVNLHLTKMIDKLARDELAWVHSIDAVSCTSLATKQKLEVMFPDMSNIRTAYKGVDLETFSQKGSAGGPQASLPPVRFLFLGGFQTWKSDLYQTENIKGGPVLLEAWKQVETQMGDSSLLLTGPGIDLIRLNEWRMTLQNPQNVHVMNAVNPEAVPSLMRACDVVIIPSLYEGLPNVANEAQACGRPVLGTDTGGISESVAHLETGLIVPKSDSKALAEGIRWFFNYQSEIEKLGAQGRQRMIAKYSWQQYARDMMDLFQSAVKPYHVV